MARQNDVGDIRSINERSVRLNNQPGAGAHDPFRAGKEPKWDKGPGMDGNKDAPAAIPMPKKHMID